jgi:AAA domain, putative AbiEii toxin, Type IV TA system/AAA ATPase domain
MNRIYISSIFFKNYKAFRRFSLSLQDTNILVGPNNCGKSTIIGALRVLAAGLRRARARKPERVMIGDTAYPGYILEPDLLPISTENVHTDYEDVDSSIDFRLSNGNVLHIYFPKRGGCALVPEAMRKRIASPAGFELEFPISVSVVPVLGPLEHEEALVKAATVQRNLHTNLASRHFRNFWFYYAQGFDEFAELVMRTWPGMEVERPEQSGETVLMFCREERMTRELFWAGFGFQIWCQLLTHISRARDDSILVIDEPEIYLHPDVQRQLLSILRGLGPSVLLATHSTEIMSEADPSEILLVEKTNRSAERLKDVAGVQIALEQIGSVQNITLTRLARSRKILFVEGSDFDLISKFAKAIGLHEVATGNEITAVKVEGFSGAERIQNIAWGMKRTLGTQLQMAAVLDRDFFPDEQIDEIRTSLERNTLFTHIHNRKELENYLLVPEVLQRAIAASSTITNPPTVVDLQRLLRDITDVLKAEVLSQFVAKRCAYFRGSGLDQATISAEAIRRFDHQWQDLDSRLLIVPGKEILRQLRQSIKEQYGVTLTDHRLVSAFRRKDIPADMLDLLAKLEQLRVTEFASE